MGKFLGHVFLVSMISLMRSEELSEDPTLKNITTSDAFYQLFLENYQKKSAQTKEQLFVRAKTRDNQSFRTSTLIISGSDTLTKEQVMILKEMGTRQMKYYFKCALPSTVCLRRCTN